MSQEFFLMWVSHGVTFGIPSNNDIRWMDIFAKNLFILAFNFLGLSF